MSSRKTYSLSLSDKAIEDFRDILSGLLLVWWTPPYANSAFISNSMGLRYPSVECLRRGL
jgi:hypothetical protein